jgi:hypothetical protein
MFRKNISYIKKTFHHPSLKQLTDTAFSYRCICHLFYGGFSQVRISPPQSPRSFLTRFSMLIDSSQSGADQTESIEWFIEDQAFLLSYDSAPRPLPPPLSCQQLVFLSQSSSVSPVELTAGEGGGGGGWGAESTARKPSPLKINQYTQATVFYNGKNIKYPV